MTRTSYSDQQAAMNALQDRLIPQGLSLLRKKKWRKALPEWDTWGVERVSDHRGVKFHNLLFYCIGMDRCQSLDDMEKEIVGKFSRLRK